MTNYANNYIPKYVPDNLEWYERDGLMTYIDILKYDNFIKDTDSHFKKTYVINFDSIYRQIRGEKLHQKLEQKYKIIDNSRISLYPDKEKDKALSSAFKCPRKDLYFKKEMIKEHFLREQKQWQRKL